MPSLAPVTTMVRPATEADSVVDVMRGAMANY
jgi:hypothetical protein